jgi:5-enolpyruvylshikimate-3-phosphate synthase
LSAFLLFVILNFYNIHTDRIMLGIENEVLEEGIKIQGGTFQQPKGMIESHHDPRISMSFAVASLRCEHAIQFTANFSFI